MTSTRRACIVLAVVAGAFLCGEARADIPYPDQITPGQPRGIALRESSAWNYGYWEYLPRAFDPQDESRRWPLLVFLGGLGMSDIPSDCPGDADVCWETQCWQYGDGLCRNTRRGPSRLIWEGAWDDQLRPFIYVTPQNDAPTISTEEWDPDELDAFLDFLVENYPIDTRRMYLIGMSQGGRGVLQYASAYPRRFAAVAPAPGGGVTPDVTCWFEDTAFWAFHGEDDANAALGTGVFDPCWMVRAVNMYNHPQLYAGQFPRCAERALESFPEGRMTMFYDLGHNAWDPAYDPIRWGFLIGSWTSPVSCAVDPPYRAYTPALDPDGVYSWFLSIDRPDVMLPDDFEVEHGAGPIEIVAAVEDDDEVTFTWAQIEGPALALENTHTNTLVVDGLVLGEHYGFEVVGIDADGQWDRDEIVVTVVEASAHGSTGPSASTDGNAEGPADGEGDTGATDGTSDDAGGSTMSTAAATTGPMGPADKSASADTSHAGCNCGVAGLDRRHAATFVAFVLFTIGGLRRRRETLPVAKAKPRAERVRVDSPSRPRIARAASADTAGG